jgi:hypothetical protein
MKKIFSLLALAVAFTATPAFAGPFGPLMQYTYLDVAYEWNDAKGVDYAHPTNGVDTKLSISPFDNFAFEGGYNYSNGDFSNGISSVADVSSINYNTWTYGVLGYYTICPGMDILARVGGNHFDANADVEDSRLSSSDDRVYAGVGTRYLLLEDLEIDGNVLYQNQDKYGQVPQWTYSGTALFAILENVALKADAGINEDSSVTLGAGVRLAM